MSVRPHVRARVSVHSHERVHWVSGVPTENRRFRVFMVGQGFARLRAIRGGPRSLDGILTCVCFARAVRFPMHVCLRVYVRVRARAHSATGGS